MVPSAKLAVAPVNPVSRGRNGQAFGPDLPVHLHLDGPGTYRLWAQFELADGGVVTAGFTVATS